MELKKNYEKLFVSYQTKMLTILDNYELESIKFETEIKKETIGLATYVNEEPLTKIEIVRTQIDENIESKIEVMVDNLKADIEEDMLKIIG